VQLADGCRDWSANLYLLTPLGSLPNTPTTQSVRLQGTIETIESVRLLFSCV